MVSLGCTFFLYSQVYPLFHSTKYCFRNIVPESKDFYQVQETLEKLCESGKKGPFWAVVKISAILLNHPAFEGALEFLHNAASTLKI